VSPGQLALPAANTADQDSSLPDPKTQKGLKLNWEELQAYAQFDPLSLQKS